MWNKKSNLTTDAKPVGLRNNSTTLFPSSKSVIAKSTSNTNNLLLSKTPNKDAKSAFFETKTAGSSSIASASSSWRTNTVSTSSSSNSIFKSTYTTSKISSTSSSYSNFSSSTVTKNIATNPDPKKTSVQGLFKPKDNSNFSSSSTVTKNVPLNNNPNKITSTQGLFKPKDYSIFSSSSSASTNNSSKITPTQQGLFKDKEYPKITSTQELVKLSPFNREFPDEPKYVTSQTYVSPYRGAYRTPYSNSLLKANEQQNAESKYKSPTTTTSGLTTKKILGAGTMLMLGSNLTKNDKSLNERPTSLYDVKSQPVKPLLMTSQSHNAIPVSSNAKALRGYMIIFNHEEFKDRKMNREGSRRDEEALCQTFYRFGFEPNVKRNLKFADIQSKVKSLTTKNFKDYGCFVAVILSHGTADEIIFAYDKTYHLNKDIINPISTNPTLVGKPKIFIIATCRGDQQELFLPKQMIKMETDSVPFMDRSSSVPYYRDILKCYSTYEGFVSYRNPQKGTVFIQTFCDILNNKGLTDSVEDIIKQVNKALTEGDNINKQVPTVVSTMSTSFCFGSLKR